MERFAVGLRRLREAAGRPGYRELSGRAHYSVATLAEAAGGRTFPSLAVTLAYVGACGGDERGWEARWREVAEELAAADAVADDQGEAPYRGLETFEPGDAEWFFGRRRLVDQLLGRLSKVSFLALFGPSGSGKSSVLRAGLLPALGRGDVPGAGEWPVLLVTPGEHPLEVLAAGLANLTGGSAKSLRDDLLAEPQSVRLAIRQALPAGTKTASVVLVIDQFEEIFTLCRDAAERACFVDCLLAAADDAAGRGRVVLGVRADFYARCAEYPALVAALCDRQVLVGAMSDDELREVIAGPAARAGLKVERALVEVIVGDAHGEPGTLPLVSHALLETWRRRRSGTLTLAGYRGAGGIQGGIAQTAERIFEGFDPEQQQIAQQLFLRLTALGEGTEDTRRRVTMTELLSGPHSAAVRAALDRLAGARLITVADNEVQVAHEALIRHWPRLREWLSEDRELLRAHRRLTEAAIDWDQHGRDDGLLYQGARLAAWDTRGLEPLNTVEHAFLSAGRRLAVSRRRQAMEHAARRRRMRLAVSGLLSAVLAVSVLAGVALMQTVRAADERDLALARQLVASARSRLPIDPAGAVRLARQAYEIDPTVQAEAVLRQATLEAGFSRPLGHQGAPVRGVAFSPDGRRLGVVTEDVVSVRDLAREGSAWRRQLLGRVDGAERAPAFHPGGRYLAGVSAYGMVHIWDLAGTGRTVLAPLDGDRRALAVAFSPDGRWLAGAGNDGTVRVWEWAEQDAEPVELGAHRGSARSVAFGPDGQTIASGGDDGTIRIWDRTGATRPVILRGHENTVTSVAYSPDGRRIASSGDDGTVRVWDAAGRVGPRVLYGHMGAVNNVAYSPDGRRIASGGDDGTLRIWDTTNGAGAALVLRGDHGAVSSAAFAPDGRSVAIGGDDGTVHLWDVLGSGDPTVLRGHVGPVWDAVASPDGRRIASAGEDGTVRIRNIDGSGEPVILHGRSSRMFGVAFTPDSTHVAGAGEDGTIQIWSADGTGDPITLREAPTGVPGITFTPDGSHMVSTSGASSGMLSQWRIGRSGEGIGSLEQNFPTPMGVSRPVKGQTVRVTDRVVRVYHNDPHMWRHRRGLEFRSMISANGRWMATYGVNRIGFYGIEDPVAPKGTDTRVVQLWNPDGTGRPVFLKGHEGQVRSVAFSPDGQLVATTAADDVVRIWHSTDNGEPMVFRYQGSSVENINFTPDGRLITTYDDGTIRIWRCEVCGPIQQVLDLAGQRAMGNR